MIWEDGLGLKNFAALEDTAPAWQSSVWEWIPRSRHPITRPGATPARPPCNTGQDVWFHYFTPEILQIAMSSVLLVQLQDQGMFWLMTAPAICMWCSPKIYIDLHTCVL